MISTYFFLNKYIIGIKNNKIMNKTMNNKNAAAKPPKNSSRPIPSDTESK